MHITDDLPNLIEKGFALSENMSIDLQKGLEVTESPWLLYFDVFYAELDSMQTVLQLLKLQKYRECFIVLRTVFEYYFLLVLMIKGKRYRMTRPYKAKPEPNLTKREYRDKAIARWKQKRESRKLGTDYIVDMNPGKEEDTRARYAAISVMDTQQYRARAIWRRSSGKVFNRSRIELKAIRCIGSNLQSKGLQLGEFIFGGFRSWTCYRHLEARANERALTIH